MGYDEPSHSPLVHMFSFSSRHIDQGGFTCGLAMFGVYLFRGQKVGDCSVEVPALAKVLSAIAPAQPAPAEPSRSRAGDPASMGAPTQLS